MTTEAAEKAEALNKLYHKKLLQELSPAEYAELRKLDRELRELMRSPEEIAKSKDMRNRRRRGKYAEKRIAKKVGGRADGRVGKKDVVQGMFSYESKSWAKIPASIVKLMVQAARLAKSGTVPVGVIYCSKPRQAFYIVDEEDWIQLHGGKKAK